MSTTQVSRSPTSTGAIQVDTKHLLDFAAAADALVQLLSGPAFTDPNIVSPTAPEIGQQITAFTDGVDLHGRIRTSTTEVVGSNDPASSLGQFAVGLKALADAAIAIASNYDQTQAEDQYSADMLRQALAASGM